MAPERVVNILQQVCGSLEEAHGRGIVHRDLKPDNVVLVERAGKKDFVKVLDFGIAKRSKEEDKDEQKLTQQGMVLGTPPYMSPEQFTGRPIDSRSDIYSLGVMAYEMLSGKLPFKADTAWEWATQHMTQPPIPIESLPEASRATEPMRAALRKALAKSPDDRFQTVREFIDAFSGGGRASPMATAPIAAGGPVRQKTEVGTPLDVGAAFGAPPPMGHDGPRPGRRRRRATRRWAATWRSRRPRASRSRRRATRAGAATARRCSSRRASSALASVAAIGFAVKGSSGGGAEGRDVRQRRQLATGAGRRRSWRRRPPAARPTPPARDGPRAAATSRRSTAAGTAASAAARQPEPRPGRPGAAAHGPDARADAHAGAQPTRRRRRRPPSTTAPSASGRARSRRSATRRRPRPGRSPASPRAAARTSTRGSAAASVTGEPAPGRSRRGTATRTPPSRRRRAGPRRRRGAASACRAPRTGRRRRAAWRRTRRRP